jgi:hypothetical protein
MQPAPVRAIKTLHYFSSISSFEENAVPFSELRRCGNRALTGEGSPAGLAADGPSTFNLEREAAHVSPWPRQKPNLTDSH